MLANIRDPHYFALLRHADDKVARSRIRVYLDWMESQGDKASVLLPQIGAYRDSLLDRGMKPSSVRSTLSTIRSAYQRLIVSPDFRADLFAYRGNAGFMEQQAFANEVVVRIQNAIDPRNSRVAVETVQDEEDGKHLRLTPAQVNQIMKLPDTSTLKGVRDQALLVLMFCTGVREQEAANLTVDDLRQYYGGELSLRVRMGKGGKTRLVPYGDLSWALVFVDRWLKAANIADGYVFRGLMKGGKVRDTRITTRAIEKIFAQYPVVIDGELCSVAPHDARRTLARNLWLSGMDPHAIRGILGHANIETTYHYIGTTNAEERRPTSIYSLPSL